MSGHESRKVGAPLLFEPESFAIACLLFLHCAIGCIVQLLMVSMFIRYRFLTVYVPVVHVGGRCQYYYMVRCTYTTDASLLDGTQWYSSNTRQY